MAVSLVVTFVVAISACAGDGRSPQDVPGGSPWQGATQIIDEATHGGASAEQVEILEQANRTGSITYDQYSAAVDRSLRCIREAGLPVPRDEVVEQGGIKLRLYVKTGDDSGPSPVAEACVKKHSWYVELAYQVQPSSVEAASRFFERYRQPLLDCLSSHDVAVDPDMTKDQIDRAVADLWDSQSVDCRGLTGYSG